MSLRSVALCTVPLLVILGQAGCRPYPAQPCSSASPCPSGYLCDERANCVPVETAGDGGPDAATDGAAGDRTPRRDAARPDHAGQDLVGVDLAEPDAGPLSAVEVVEVSAIFAHVFRNESGLPLIVRLHNNTDRELALYSLQLLWNDSVEYFRWNVPLPQPLPARTTTAVAVRFSVGPEAPIGDIVVDGYGVIFDENSHQASTAGPARQPGRFRVEVTPLLDTDNDGLSNQVEANLSTDPANPDSDGDGLDDGIETAVGLDPRDSDSDGTIDALEDDADNSGEPDLLEWRRHSDPTSPLDDRTYNPVVVNQATDAASGTAGHITLRQAISIANTDQRPTRISFNLTAPIDVAETLVGGESVLPALTEPDTFIDGRVAGRRQVIAWDSGIGTRLTLWQLLAPGTTIRDLAFDLTPTPHVADRRAWVFEGAEAATVTLAHLTFEIGADPQRMLISVGSFSGCDDLLIFDWQAALSTSWSFESGIHLSECYDSVVRRSRFEVLSHSLSGSCGSCLIEQNYFSGYGGVQNDGTGMTLRRNEIIGYGTAAVGTFSGPLRVEDNNIHDSEVGVGIWHCDGCTDPITGIEVRRNRFVDITYPAIEFDLTDQAGILAPVVTSATISHVSGTHGGADGTVIEVFVGQGNDADQFIGETRLQGHTWTVQATAPLPVGRNATATAVDAAGNTSMLATPQPIR